MNVSGAAILAGVAVAIALGPRPLHAARSARPVTAVSKGRAEGFDRNESAALFVGVQRFTHRELIPVRYAADDAVDLAYLFVFDSRISLVRADRVVLALSGRPEKPESQQHLERLQRAGATIRHADQTDIVALLRRQAALAGKKGLLIVSLATHGFARAGDAYILGASSVVQYPATTVPVARILDIAALSAGRSLVLIDACRERLSAPTRSVTRQRQTGPPLQPTMGHTHGQAVLFAAAAGDVAYDGNGNGVFTKAVIDGLQCRAAKPHGVITAWTLGIYVQDSALRWVHRHIDKSIRSAIQSNIDGGARNMPLSQCWPTDREPRTFDSKARQEWQAREGMPFRAMAVGDLFRDHRQEAVTLWGKDTSRLVIYSPEGERISYVDLPGSLNHVAVGRPTKHHAPKIVVAGKTTVMVFSPKTLSRGKPLWTGRITPRDQSAERIEIIDSDKDGKNEISVKTENGTLVLDFEGKLVARHVKKGSLQFHLLHSRRKRP